jgi:hypothetical protein
LGSWKIVNPKKETWITQYNGQTDGAVIEKIKE